MKICSAVLMLLAFSVASIAAVIVVPVEVASIQAAIDSSADGDTVLVAPGEYEENIDFNGTDVAVLAIGGPRVTTIRAAEASSVVTIVSGESPRAVLFGFTITGGVAARDGYGGGIVIERSSPTIIGNVITGNRAEQGGGGISASFVPAVPIITRNLIVDNRTDGGGGGVSYYQCSGILINNTIVGNSSGTDGGGVNLPFTAGLRAINNIIANNQSGRGGAVAGWMAQAARFTYNDVWGNAGGQYANPIQPGEGSISEDPQFVDAQAGNYRLRRNSPCVDTGDPELPNDIDGSRSDMGCYPLVDIANSPLELDPSEVEWDVIDAGDSASMRVTVINPTESAARVLAMNNPESPFRMDPALLEIDAGGDGEAELWFAPREAGRYADSLGLVVLMPVGINDTLTLWLPQGRESFNLRGEARAVSVADPVLLPEKAALVSCYPNPFNARLTVAVVKDHPIAPKVTVWSLAGELAAELTLTGGNSTRWLYRWEADRAAPGVYWVRVSARDEIPAHRVILLK